MARFRKYENSPKYFILLVTAVSLVLFFAFFWPYGENIEGDYEILASTAHSLVDTENQVIRITEVPEDIAISQNFEEGNIELVCRYRLYDYLTISYTILLSQDFTIVKEYRNHDSEIAYILLPLLISLLLSVWIGFDGTVIVIIIIALVIVSWKILLKKESNRLHQ